MNLPATLLFVSFAFQTSGVPAKYLATAPAKDKVLAKVNGAPITAGDVEDFLWQWRGQEATSDLIGMKVMMAAAAKAKVTVTDKEIEDAMQTQIANLTPQVTKGLSPDDFMLSMGFTRSRSWIRIKTELLLNKLAALDFKPAQYIKVSTIVIKPEGPTTAALSNAAKKADLFYDKLIKGESWESVLQLSSTIQGVIDSKGSVGWRTIDAFPQEVRSEFNQVKVGGYTKPVQTQNGFQIFRIDMFGKDAKEADLKEAVDIHVLSNRPATLQKVQSENKVERFPQNS